MSYWQSSMRRATTSGVMPMEVGATSARRAHCSWPNGEILVSGEFTEGLDIGGIVLDSRSSNDVFLAKFDASGIPRWVRSPSWTDGGQHPKLAQDLRGNLVVSLNLSAAMPSGRSPAWIRIDDQGDELQRLTSTAIDFAWAESVNLSSALTVSGRFRGVLTMGDATLTSSAADPTGFIFRATN